MAQAKFQMEQVVKADKRAKRLSRALEDAQKYRGMKRKTSTALKKTPAAKKRATITKANNTNVATMYTYPLPQKMNTRLKVILNNLGLISALTSSSSLVYRPTSYFDVDPAVGGPSFAGYTFYASVYGAYRVLAFKYKATFLNLETDGVLVSCQAIASSATPGSGTATDYTEPAIENDYGKYALVGPTAATPEKVITGYVNCTKLWGRPEAKTAPEWAGSTGSNPTVNSWLRIAAKRINGGNLATGCQCVLEIESYGYWDTKNPDITG